LRYIPICLIFAQDFEEACTTKLVEGVPPSMPALMGLFLTMLVGYVALAVLDFVWISQLKITSKYELGSKDGIELM